eukprot:6181225-Pleurochrysis_carterae.AAC.1
METFECGESVCARAQITNSSTGARTFVRTSLITCLCPGTPAAQAARLEARIRRWQIGQMMSKSARRAKRRGKKSRKARRSAPQPTKPL